MKKFIALLLSLVMVVSSLGVLASAESASLADLVGDVDFAQALENFNADGMELPDEYLDENFEYDMEELLQSGALNNLNLFGLTVDFLYHNSDDLFWTTLTIEKSDLALAKANLNMYLLRVLKNHFGDDKLYTAKNAEAIANFIGHLINEDFTDVTVIYNSEPVSEATFYKTVADFSGLDEVIQHNWCDQPTINFKPLIYALGVNFNDLLERDFSDGQVLAEALIKAVITRNLQNGPVNYILDLVAYFSKTYGISMAEPIKALLKSKIVRGVIGEDELDTFRGLLNLVFNNNNPDDTTKLQFMTPPTYRFAIAKDSTEVFLYLLAYLNLDGRYKSNSDVIKNYQAEISANTFLDNTEKERINSVLSGVFLGDLSGIVAIIDDLVIENIEEGKNDLWKNFVNFLVNMIKNFIGMFDKIYQSLSNIGKG
ncbi:MAG: hypothetical protein ACI4SB_06055 [Acutalibacteraceae bacterium]